MRIVRRGTWLYDGQVRRPVDIVALDHDFWFSLGEADDSLEPGEQPQVLGPDGYLYYVRFQKAGDPTSPTWVDSGGFESIAEAKALAETTAPSPIRWRR